MRKLVFMLLLCIGLTAFTSSVVPTPPAVKRSGVSEQWDAALEFVRQYRPLLFKDSVRLTDSLALQIVQAADSNQVDRRLAFQLVMIESRFKPTALSNKGARGLTQVMPSTGQTVCAMQPRELYEAEKNLNCGFYYLRSLLDRYNDNEWFALTAYYRGPRRADQIKELGFGYPESILES